MCTPPSPAASGDIATGLQIAGLFNATQGAGDKARANRTAYEYQAAVERNKAQVSEWQARDAITRGQIAQANQRLKTASLRSTQRATFAARGLDMSQGSPLAILQDTEYLGNLDAATIHDNAAREAWALRQSAATGLSNADLLSWRGQQENPTRAMGDTLLTGAGAVATNWYRLRRPGYAAD